MKTKYWILILAGVLVACLGLSAYFLMPGDTASYAEVTSAGKVVKTVDLRIDQEFTVTAAEGGRNVITVKDGKIGVTQADCPDHYCMERGMINSGAQIVCLPNRLVITLTGEQSIDGVAG